jgi:hypothetical protein
VNKDIKDLGLDSYEGSSPTQFSAIRVDCTVLE